MTHVVRALQTHDLSGEGINFGSQIYFFDHTRTWRASPDQGSAQCLGHLWDNTGMKDDTHHLHTHSFEKGEYEWIIMTAKWYSGTSWAKSFLTFILQVRKNLTQETCPDRGSNPGPLRERRACYRLPQGGGHRQTDRHTHTHTHTHIFLKHFLERRSDNIESKFIKKIEVEFFVDCNT